MLFILKNGGRTGPYTIDQVVASIRKGELLMSDLAWREGKTDWEPIHTDAELVAAVLPPIFPDLGGQKNQTATIKRDDVLPPNQPDLAEVSAKRLTGEPPISNAAPSPPQLQHEKPLATKPSVPSHASDELATRRARFYAAILDGTPGIITVWGIGYESTSLIVLGGLCTLFFIIINCYLLTKRGQTIGKILLKIKVVDRKNGQIPGFWRVAALRYLLFNFVFAAVWHGILSLVDVVFIFGHNRRCVHDMIASTNVVIIPGQRAI